MNKEEEIKIVMGDNRIITRKELFKRKEIFHKELAKIPFEEKIKMLIYLQKIVHNIKKSSKGKQSNKTA